MMPRTTYFTISTGADIRGNPKDGLLFSKVSDDDDNCEYMVIEVEDISNPPFIKKRIKIKDIRAIAELFTKWADELGVE